MKSVLARALVGVAFALCFLSGDVGAWKFGAQASACPPAATFVQRDVVATPGTQSGVCSCAGVQQQQSYGLQTTTTTQVPTVTQQQVTVQQDVLTQGYSTSGTTFRQVGVSYDVSAGFGTVGFFRDPRFFGPAYGRSRGFRDVVPIQPVGPTVVGGSILDVRRGLFGSRTRATGAAAEIAAAHNIGRRGLFRGR